MTSGQLPKSDSGVFFPSQIYYWRTSVKPKFQFLFVAVSLLSGHWSTILRKKSWKPLERQIRTQVQALNELYIKYTSWRSIFKLSLLINSIYMAYFQDRKSWKDNEKWPDGIFIINFHFSFGKILTLLTKAKEKYILINLFEDGPHKRGFISGPPEFSKPGIQTGGGIKRGLLFFEIRFMLMK